MLLPARIAPPLDGPFIPYRSLPGDVGKHKLTIYSLPAGSLVPEALATALRARCDALLWVSLTPADRDPATLMYALALAAQPHAPALLDTVRELLRRPPSPRQGWRPAFGALADAIGAALPAGCAIVFEALDQLSPGPGLGLIIGELLPALADCNPCVMITAHDRSPADLPATAQRYGAAALRLTLSDLAALAEQTGLALPDAALRRALRLLGGQADSLYSLLRVLGPHGSAEAAGLIGQAKSADDLRIRSARLQLDRECVQARRALALSRHLGCFYPDLGVAAGVGALPAAGWLLPLANGWSRLRGVWHDALPWALREEEMTSMDTLERAANFFAQRGIIEAAAPLYLQLHAYEQAAALLSASLDTLMGMGQYAMLQAWLARLPPPALHAQPWLIYAQGEIAALQQDVGCARRSFALAADRFAARDDAAGLCQSLLAESAMFERQGDAEQASDRILSALGRAEAANVIWYQGWAAWQLVGLAMQRGDLGLAMAHLDRVLSTALAAGEQMMTELLRPLEELMVRYREISEQRELYRQALVSAEQAATQVHGRLQALLGAGPQAIEAYPWTITPLVLRLFAPDPPRQSAAAPGARLWQVVMRAFERRADAPEVYVALPAPPPADIPAARADEAPPAHVIQYARAAPDAADATAARAAADEAPMILAHMLGPFRLSLAGLAIESWPSGRGRSLLKYLLIHRQQPVARDMLMDLFWPEASPEYARNNLNVAMHGLRQALRQATRVPVVEYLRGAAAYRLNPDLPVWVDVDEFDRRLQLGHTYEADGQLTLAITHYEQAASIYQGDFMADDLYDDWSVLRREQLRLAHLDLLDRLSQIYFSQGQYAPCASLCQKILACDSCREDAHCRLMRCYSRQGQQHLSLLQYQICTKALASDIGVEPLDSTTQLAERIRRREYV